MHPRDSILRSSTVHPRDRLFPSIRESRRVRSMFQFCIVVLKLCVVARVNLHLTYHSRIVYCPNTNQSTTRHGFAFVLDRPHSISTPCQLSRLPGHCPPTPPPRPAQASTQFSLPNKWVVRCMYVCMNPPVVQVAHRRRSVRMRQMPFACVGDWKTWCRTSNSASCKIMYGGYTTNPVYVHCEIIARSC